MEDFKKQYEELMEALDTFIDNLKYSAKEESQNGGVHKQLKEGLILNIAQDLEELVYEDYPKCESCGCILKEDTYTFDDHDKYCETCYNDILEESHARKVFGHESLSRTERNK